MNELERRYDVTKKDLAKGRRMKIGAWSAPVLLSVVPFLILFISFLAFESIPLFFFSIIFGVLGLLLGLVISGVLAYRYSNWTKAMRERIAADGIRAEEIGWFIKELKPAERLALKEIESGNLLLADAYRETLASRLTATRIVKSSRQELQLAKRRQNKLKYLKSENSKAFQAETVRDIEKISSINKEAEQMLHEAETRLQMIEAASRRGTNLADSELALKKLSARTQELPLALEEAKRHDEIRRELEKELDKET
ncbi:MAG: hypothetical protein JWN60_2678 [Acidobacteria bacterium]|jgi:uncharacterized membrane protein YccC|nr:hypothetical protein [Acidobacteriota bacterium]